MSDKLTPAQVHYVAVSKKDHDCDDCRHFQKGGACSQVEGSISPEGGCDIFNATNPFFILGPAAAGPCAEKEPEQ